MVLHSLCQSSRSAQQSSLSRYLYNTHTQIPLQPLQPLSITPVCKTTPLGLQQKNQGKHHTRLSREKVWLLNINQEQNKKDYYA